MNMTETETYNGWKNRETWAFNLHWSNDQGLYNETLEEARRYIEETYGKAGHLIHDEDERRAAYYGAAEHVVSYWRDAIEDDEQESGDAHLYGPLVMMRNEVGSWWRIDIAETAESLRESLANES